MLSKLCDDLRWIAEFQDIPYYREIILDAVDTIETLSADKPTGKWWIREYEYFTCSECGNDYWNGCDCTEEAKERLRNGDYPNFCPNCGAEMEV